MMRRTLKSWISASKGDRLVSQGGLKGQNWSSDFTSICNLDDYHQAAAGATDPGENTEHWIIW